VLKLRGCGARLRERSNLTPEDVALAGLPQSNENQAHGGRDRCDGVLVPGARDNHDDVPNPLRKRPFALHGWAEAPKYGERPFLSRQYERRHREVRPASHQNAGITNAADGARRQPGAVEDTRYPPRLRTRR